MELDHIAFIVSNEDVLRFYEKLGFEEIWRKTRAYDIVVLMDNAGIRPEIFVDSNHPKRTDSPEQMGLRHIGFTVDNLDEIAEIVDC